MSRRRNKTLRAGSMSGMVYHCGFKAAKKKSADAAAQSILKKEVKPDVI